MCCVDGNFLRYGCFFIMRSTCNSSFQETEVKIKHGMIHIIFFEDSRGSDKPSGDIDRYQ